MTMRRKRDIAHGLAAAVMFTVAACGSAPPTLRDAPVGASRNRGWNSSVVVSAGDGNRSIEILRCALKTENGDFRAGSSQNRRR
jgi:hypothetical protein